MQGIDGRVVYFGVTFNFAEMEMQASLMHNSGVVLALTGIVRPDVLGELEHSISIDAYCRVGQGTCGSTDHSPSDLVPWRMV
jgi:hypothetical protein